MNTDDFLKQYSDKMSNISVPDSLSARTYNAVQRNKDSSMPRRRAIFAASNGIFIVCVLAVVLFLNIKSPVIKTPLVSGEFKQRVELKNGSLIDFNQLPTSLLNADDPFFAPIDLKIEEWSSEQYWEYLGKKVDLSSNVFTLSGEKAVVFFDDEGFIKSDKYTAEYKGLGTTLKLTLAKGWHEQIFYSNDISVINMSPVYMAYREGNDEYLAYFYTDGVSYYLSSQGLDQESFIYIVLGIIS